MSHPEGYVKVSLKALHDACVERFTAAGMPAEEAEIIACSLVAADQRGVQTHGVVCVPRYLSLIRQGKMRAKAAYETVRDNGVIAVWDGRRSSGQVLGHWAMLEAARKAKAHGIGLVAVRHSNHFGAAAYYAQLAAARGMIGIAMSTGSSTMAPWGGADRLIGNNPVAVAVPAARHPDIVLDMAMSNVAFGKISNLKKAGEKAIPAGWAYDADGVETTDIDRVETVIPMGAHKGFGMALIVDIVSGLLFGGATGARAGDDAEGPSCLFAALRPDAFGDSAAFMDALDARVGELKGSRLARGAREIMMPGEIEARQQESARETVWIMPEILRDVL